MAWPCDFFFVTLSASRCRFLLRRSSPGRQFLREGFISEGDAKQAGDCEVEGPIFKN